MWGTLWIVDSSQRHIQLHCSSYSDTYQGWVDVKGPGQSSNGRSCFCLKMLWSRYLVLWYIAGMGAHICRYAHIRMHMPQFSMVKRFFQGETTESRYGASASSSSASSPVQMRMPCGSTIRLAPARLMAQRLLHREAARTKRQDDVFKVALKTVLGTSAAPSKRWV